MNKGFLRLPVALLDLDISDKAILVYALMLDRADERYIVKYKQRLLAKRLRCNERTIRRAVKELKECGLIEETAVSSSQNEYTLQAILPTKERKWEP